MAKRIYWFIRYPTAKQRFEKIYESNYWASGESFSGYGSHLEATRLIRSGLSVFIRDHQIKSMLDIPCGDFNWVRQMNLDLNYIGADIVSELVRRNQELHGCDCRSFHELDLTRSALPQADLVLTRDCLNHLSFSDIQKAADNVVASGSTYFAVTQFPNIQTNKNQETGFTFRKLNFRLPPFNWPEPYVEYPETTDGAKTLAVWRITDLPSR